MKKITCLAKVAWAVALTVSTGCPLYISRTATDGKEEIIACKTEIKEVSFEASPGFEKTTPPDGPEPFHVGKAALVPATAVRKTALVTQQNGTVHFLLEIDPDTFAGIDEKTWEGTLCLTVNGEILVPGLTEKGLIITGNSISVGLSDARVQALRRMLK